MAEPHYLTKPELAARYRITVRTLERWILEGKCPPITRFGRRVLFGIENVRDWERRHS